MTLTDYYTKWAEAAALKDKSAQTWDQSPYITNFELTTQTPKSL